MKDLNTKVLGENNKNTIQLIEIFALKISGSLQELSLKGFTESKMPDDLLIKQL